MTVGTVIKFQYDLPTNSTEYTSRIYGFADTVARSRDEKSKDGDNDDLNNIDSEISSEIESSDSRDLDEFEENEGTTISNDLEKENDTLIDVTFDDNRRKRSLAYAEGGLMADVTTESELSLDEAIRRQEIIDRNAMEEEEPQRMNRWDFYKVIERMVER